MNVNRFLMRLTLVAVVFTLGLCQSYAQLRVTPSQRDGRAIAQTRVTQAQREAAAKRLAAARASVNKEARYRTSAVMTAAAMTTPVPGGVPDYIGSPNWANSPTIRKFMDGLPGLRYANRNNLQQYISVANPDTIKYPGSDYYEISVRQFTERFHRDLDPTTLRGYVQTNYGTDTNGQNTIEPSPIRYLGPLIMAKKDRPVRIKFTNELPTGKDGDLFLPVDTTVMGAGMGPMDMPGMPGMKESYTQNRAVIHLHGGRTPWISDGTPHQWITPAEEMTMYPKGVSVTNVPDMPDPGPGSQTYYFTNQQSARLMFYHDHSFGITRLNVYAGEAAGYLIEDQTEQALTTSNLIPAEQIPLIIQDKSFVDDNIHDTDPTWNWGTGIKDPVTGIRTPKSGDLWYPHVYVPAQNPYDLSGANSYGRWHYGPWFWPPTSDIAYGPVPNPYYDPINAPWQPPEMPGTPNPSMPGESFFDIAMVNGTAYPTLTVQPKAYRFRILNAANDRFWNLQLYEADSTVTSSDGRTNTEVKMVSAAPTVGFPETWPVDGREGGVPDPNTAGPSWIQIGTEGGFLPAPAVIPNQPIAWNLDPTTFNFGNVSEHSLLIAPAERADVIVDFSQHRNKTFILYNDAPAAFPALDARYDYYTGAPDLTETGGHSGPQAGFSPNTRTIMQIKVDDTEPALEFGLTALEEAFASTATTQGVFASGQDPILVGQSAYDSTYNTTFPATWPNWGYSRIQDKSLSIKTLAGTTLTIPMRPKAIQDEMGEAFDEYGRMSGKLGLELPNTSALNQNFVLQNYVDPPTEIINDSMTPMSPVLGDGTQIWKITHNGVDTHPIHFHLFDVQLLNRVGWDGAIRLPDANELGWKDTVRVSPLEDTIVALRAVAPKQPFGIPDSIRPLNPSEPIGSKMGFTSINPLTGEAIIPGVSNQIINFGWEYVWHCHILSHEEMDMMRPIVFNVARQLPAASVLAGLQTGASINLSWTDTTPASAPQTLGNPANEIGFRIERALGTTGAFATIGTALANATSYADTTFTPGRIYRYRVNAYNAAGTKASNIVPIAAATATAPGAPTAVTAVADNAQATVSFTEPASNGGSVIRSYTVTSSPGGRTATGTASPLTVTGLTNGTAYTFTVKATNAVGSSLASSPSNSVTPVSVPGAPTSVTAVSGNAQAIVSFAAPVSNGGSVITSYTVTSSTGGIVATGAASPIIVIGLTNGTSYTFTVEATNAVGTGLPSNPSNSVTPEAIPAAAAPGAPISVTAVAGYTQATVSFMPPVLNGGSPITSYTVISNPGGRTAIRTSSPITVTGLTNGTSYTFTVKATNAIGTSPASAPSNSVVPGRLPTAPTNLRTTSIGITTINLAWTDNASNELGFYVDRSSNNGATWVRVNQNAVNSILFRDTGLTTKTTYRYRVQAFNATGVSAFSNILTVTTR